MSLSMVSDVVMISSFEVISLDPSISCQWTLDDGWQGHGGGGGGGSGSGRGGGEGGGVNWKDERLCLYIAEARSCASSGGCQEAAARSKERTYRHFGHRHPEPSAELYKLDVKSPPFEVEVLKN